MMAVAMSQLARAHQAPPPGYAPQGQEAILIRYDGHSLNGDPIIYAQISIEDAARIPERVFSQLSLSDDEIEHGFFMQSQGDETFVFIDTDKHERFLDRAIAALEEAGIACHSAVGDLQAMRDAEGDLFPPACPAFIDNGMEFVDLDTGLERMAEARRRLEADGADLPGL